MTSTTPAYHSDTTNWLFAEAVANIQDVSKPTPVEPPVADQRLVAWNNLFAYTAR